ncbi:MAG: thermonuclease family protein [Akkermansia sp.]|nr:thermonuclease family protein [Akkermansia sp.]
MSPRHFLLCLSAFVSLLLPSAAEMLFGHCVGVADGDTCTLLLTQPDGVKKTERIRFHGIDAPESHQAYGQAAKKFVSDLIYDKDIRVDVQTRDKYGRLVGKVFVGGAYVNLEVVKAGYAWWYRQYGAGETAIAAAEQEARTACHGLWLDKNPVAPWDFRHKGARAASPASASSTDSHPAAESQRYWVTASSGKTHNASCRWYADSQGYYSSTGTGNNCKICGGAD